MIVDTDELEKLRTEDDKAIQIDTFINPDALDPVYYAGKTYYLVPDGPVGQKPYTVLYEAMEQENRQAIARVVMHGREQLVLLRPLGSLITMSPCQAEHGDAAARRREGSRGQAAEEDGPEHQRASSCSSPEEEKLVR